MVHVAAGDVQRRVMPANCLLARAVQKAVDLAVAIVIQLNLPHTELVGSAVPRSPGYLLDGGRRQCRAEVGLSACAQRAGLRGPVRWNQCGGSAGILRAEPIICSPRDQSDQIEASPGSRTVTAATALDHDRRGIDDHTSHRA